MRVVVLISLLLPTLAHAAPVHLVQQGRLMDTTGVPIQGDHSVTVTLCPNLTPTVGETCRNETFNDVPFDDGYFSVILGTEDTLDHSVFDAPNLSVSFTVGGSALGNRQRVAQLVPRNGGMLYLGSATDADCSDDTHESALIYRNGLVQVCTATGWKSLAFGETLVQVDGVRRWSDGSFAASCEDYIRPADEDRLYVGSTGDGVYRIDPDGLGSGAAFDVWCDMTSDGGGFTLVMNLDTSDGHAMWWGNSLWTNGSTYGSVDANPFDGDLVSQAYTQLGAGSIRIVVHEQGVVRGSKRWAKPSSATVAAAIAGGDNTVLGSSVAASDVSGLSSSEFLVRTTTTLYANHCVNGTCVTDTGGSPDGHRIGSSQAAPSNNNGGGIGNWADINYCCGMSSLAGHSCNGDTVRTASEAQGGWGSAYGGSHNTGTFGTDSLFPMNNTGSNTSCSQANWAAPNGIAYDYAIYVR